MLIFVNRFFFLFGLTCRIVMDIGLHLLLHYMNIYIYIYIYIYIFTNKEYMKNLMGFWTCTTFFLYSWQPLMLTKSIYFIINRVKTIILVIIIQVLLDIYFFLWIFKYNWFLWCIAEFSASVLRVTWCFWRIHVSLLNKNINFFKINYNLKHLGSIRVGNRKSIPDSDT